MLKPDCNPSSARIRASVPRCERETENTAWIASSDSLNETMRPRGFLLSCWLSNLIALGSGISIEPDWKITLPILVEPASTLRGTIFPEIVRLAESAVSSAEKVITWFIAYLDFH